MISSRVAIQGRWSVSATLCRFPLTYLALKPRHNFVYTSGE
jgi:hypothetical protein